jgi:hypothetical protein
MMSPVLRLRGVSNVVLAAMLAACAGGTAGPSGSPAVSPTAPSPSPGSSDIASAEPSGAALRTALEVNSDIRPRVGVPSDMADTLWWTDDDAGEVGTTAELGVPLTEWILAAGAGVVVSATGDRMSGPATLIVREIRTGREVRQIDTGLLQVVAAVVGRRLFWAGARSIDPDGRAVDGGVWTVDLSDAGAPVAVVPGGADLGSPGGRSRFTASPTGRTLASGAGSFQGVSTDLIDVEHLTLRRHLAGMAAFALTDDIVLVPDHPPTDTAGGGVIARSIATGSSLWRFPVPAVEAPYGLKNVEALGDRFVIEYTREIGSNVELVVGSLSPRGVLTELLVLDGVSDPIGQSMTIDWQISTPSHLAITRDGLEGAILAREPIALLDLRSGVLDVSGFVLDPPWFCYAGTCRRD